MPEYERGQYFEENRNENIKGKVIIDTTENLHGRAGYRLAERENGDDGVGWYAYWQPAQQLHDEIGVGWTSEAGELGPDKLEQVEENVAPSDSENPTKPELIDEDARRLKDVMPVFTDYHQIEQ